MREFGPKFKREVPKEQLEPPNLSAVEALRRFATEIDPKAIAEMALREKEREALKDYSLKINQLLLEAEAFIEKRAEENGINFLIEEGFDRTTKGIALFLKKNDGEIFDLSSLLPPEHKFSIGYGSTGPGGNFYYSPDNKIVYYDSDDIKTTTFVLKLLHEIGHSKQKSPHFLPLPQKIAGYSHAVFNFFKEWLIELKSGPIKAASKALELPLVALKPEWFVEKSHKHRARSEREASAYALHQLRELQKAGYNVFAGFESVKELRAYVGFALYSYELMRSIDFILARRDRKKPVYIKSLPK